MSLGNVLISVVRTELYPDKFEFNALFVLSLALLFFGIYIYEGKKVDEGLHERSVKNTRMLIHPPLLKYYPAVSSLVIHKCLWNT